jgi:hypothetical protein
VTKETNVIILLPLLRRLNARTRLAAGIALTTVGLFLIIAALAHGVIAVIVGTIVLDSCRALGVCSSITPAKPSRSDR